MSKSQLLTFRCDHGVDLYHRCIECDKATGLHQWQGEEPTTRPTPMHHASWPLLPLLAYALLGALCSILFLILLSVLRVIQP